MRFTFSPGLIFIALLSLPMRVAAYIPETSYIFTQATKHQGKGAYVVTQDVTFKHNFDTMTVQEKWVIQDGFNLAVSVATPSVQYQAIYDMNGRWISTDHGREHTEWPSDFAEGFFNARNVAQFYRLIQSSDILTSEQLAGPPKPTGDARFSYAPNPNVRLARAEGKPCWTFGLPTSESNSKGLPMLWVEQDGFTVQRIRTQGGGDQQVGEYGHFVKGFDYPKTRHYLWNGNDIVAQVARVEVASLERARAALSWHSVEAHKTALTVKSGPLSEMIQEFYTRFR